jgi:hypothetical protein
MLDPDPHLCQKLQKLDDFRILVKNGNNVEVALPWSSWVWRPAKPAAAVVLLAQLFSPRTKHALGRPLPPYVCNKKQKLTHWLPTKNSKTKTRVSIFKRPMPLFFDIYFNSYKGTVLWLMRSRLHTTFRLGFACGFVG